MWEGAASGGQGRPVETLSRGVTREGPRAWAEGKRPGDGVRKVRGHGGPREPLKDFGRWDSCLILLSRGVKHLIRP